MSSGVPPRPSASLDNPAGAAVGSRGRSSLLLAAVLLLAAFNLRAAIASVPPLLDRIEADLGLSAAAAGVLTALPLICMGAFAPVAQRLGTRYGRESTMAGALAVLTAGTAVRYGSGHLAALYGGTLLIGVGIAVTQTVLPGVVKEHFAAHGGVMTGLYSTLMALGATIGAAIAVPVTSALGSWERSLAVWALPALLATLCWLPATARLRRAPTTADAGAPTRLPWRSGIAWLVSLYIAAQSIVFYSELSWLAPLYQQHGWSASRAGLALALFNLLGIIGSLSAPSLASRMDDRRPMFAVAVGCNVVALPGLALAAVHLPWLWVTLAGIGQGGAFALGLLLLVDHAHDPAASARLSAMAFLVCYCLAAVGPVLVGGLRDLTGGYTAAFLLVAGVAVVELVLAMTFTPERRRRAVTELSR